MIEQERTIQIHEKERGCEGVGGDEDVSVDVPVRYHNKTVTSTPTIYSILLL